MVVKKGPLIALNAFLDAAQTHPGMSYTMIGDGPLLSAVRERCRLHAYGHKVTLAGALPHHEALKAIAKADIFLQHSITDPVTGDQEGAPVAILEAMARGVPIISTYHSGIPYLVENGVSGLLSEEGNVALMASNLLRLANDPDLRHQMGFESRKRAHYFSWERERETLSLILFGSPVPAQT
jgi:glycosyltransferase involved in cell wall biosynthesis